MKKRIVLPSFICLLAVSCTVKELDIAPIRAEDDEVVFYATMESGSEQDTKVYLDNESFKIFWNAEDKVSIFNKSTLNQQYEFDGQNGENSGSFHRVPNGYFGAGNDLDYICSVYPYQESTSISNSGELTFILPAEQTYKENSFGLGANTMVSVTDDYTLQFKNVGGYLGLKFYGEGVSVSSIRLTGHSGEKLSGKATVKEPAIGQIPVIEMAPETVGSSIVLNCETPVQLGASAENPTIFWMVVPPTDFTQGLTVTITNPDGDVFILETNRTDLKIERNKIMRFSATKVDFDFDSEEFSLTDILPVNEKPTLMTNLDEANRTIIVTMPTVTDFSDLLFDYAHTGTGVMVNGVNIKYENSIPTTHINASRKTDEDGFHLASVVVRNGKYGKNYTLKARNTGLPVVRINTKGFTLTDLEGEMNSLQSEDGLDHRTWHSGTTVRIENADGSAGMNEVLSDGYSKNPAYQIATEIKGRGNYSWKWDKRPYALKLDKKREVLGMPAHKRWVLLANWRDRTLLRNDATFWLAKKATDELPYTTRGQFVELEFNGEYRGNYYLCEQIKIDENRVNITEIGDNAEDRTGGFLMEIDSYFDEVNKFLSEPFGLRYMFKEPDEDADALEAAGEVELANNYRAAYSWMQSHINEFETVLKTKSAVEAKEYKNYLDVNSAIMFMLLNELVANGDFFQTSTEEVYGPHSTYLYKDKGENAKIYMGPIWDFDYLTFTSYSRWRGFDSKKYYYYYMCHNQDFVDQIKFLWTKYKTVFAGLTDYIDDMARKLSLSQKFDEKRWPYATNQANRNDNKDYYENGQVVPYLTAIERMKTYFKARIDWMNTKINSLEPTNPSGYYRNGRWIAGDWLYP